MALRRKITDNNIIKNYKTSHYKSFNFDNIIIPSDKTYTNEVNTSTNILNAKNITIIGQNMKIPLYNNPLFSPKQLSERTNSEINFSKKDNLNRTFEPNTLYLSNKIPHLRHIGFTFKNMTSFFINAKILILHFY